MPLKSTGIKDGSDELIDMLETMVTSNTIRSFEDLDSALEVNGYRLGGENYPMTETKELNVKDSAMAGYWIYCSKQMESPVNMVGSLYKFEFNDKFITRVNEVEEERFPYTLIAIDYLYRGGDLKNERIWELGDEWKMRPDKGLRILHEYWTSGEDKVRKVMGNYKIYVFTSSEFIELFGTKFKIINWVVRDPLQINKN
tara:strand:- start:3867 stop:4463 length:597 start_codon:yes stop_codon:yes gene_type:complete